MLTSTTGRKIHLSRPRPARGTIRTTSTATRPGRSATKEGEIELDETTDRATPLNDRALLRLGDQGPPSGPRPSVDLLNAEPLPRSAPDWSGLGWLEPVTRHLLIGFRP